MSNIPSSLPTSQPSPDQQNAAGPVDPDFDFAYTQIAGIYAVPTNDNGVLVENPQAEPARAQLEQSEYKPLKDSSVMRASDVRADRLKQMMEMGLTLTKYVSKGFDREEGSVNDEVKKKQALLTEILKNEFSREVLLDFYIWIKRICETHKGLCADVTDKDSFSFPEIINILHIDWLKLLSDNQGYVLDSDAFRQNNMGKLPIYYELMLYIEMLLIKGEMDSTDMLHLLKAQNYAVDFYKALVTHETIYKKLFEAQGKDSFYSLKDLHRAFTPHVWSGNFDTSEFNGIVKEVQDIFGFNPCNYNIVVNGNGRWISNKLKLKAFQMLTHPSLLAPAHDPVWREQILTLLGANYEISQDRPVKRVVPDRTSRNIILKDIIKPFAALLSLGESQVKYQSEIVQLQEKEGKTLSE